MRIIAITLISTLQIHAIQNAYLHILIIFWSKNGLGVSLIWLIFKKDLFISVISTMLTQYTFLLSTDCISFVIHWVKSAVIQSSCLWPIDRIYIFHIYLSNSNFYTYYLVINVTSLKALTFLFWTIKLVNLTDVLVRVNR